MNRQNSILISFLAISVVLALGYKGFGWENNFKPARTTEVVQSGGDNEIARIISLLTVHEPTKLEAWQVFENYLEFARTHNLSGVRSLSHQISAACSDSSSEEECFALMDNVYVVASQFKLSEFKHVQMDEHQIIMFTDGPVVAILYFTRDQSGAPKMLGLRFCLEDETVSGNCVETNPSQHDLDNNGWWDSVESLFYDY